MARRSPRHLSVFLGSPSDVPDERKAAREVLSELHDHPLVRRKFTIALQAWTRRSPLEGNADPQRAVVKYVGRPSESDLAVILLSGRLGTPLGQLKPDGSPYRSGTEWEFEDARRAKKPIFLYVRRHPPKPQTNDDMAQRRALAEFLAGLTDAGGAAVNHYDNVADFREIFRDHLFEFIGDLDSRPPWHLRAAWAALAALVVAGAAFFLVNRPTVKVDSVKAYLTRDHPQQVQLAVNKAVVHALKNDECLVEVSETSSFEGARGDMLENPTSVVEDSVGCGGESDLVVQLAETRPHAAAWSGWVRVALSRGGDRIAKSDPYPVNATTGAAAEAPDQPSAKR